MADCDVRSRGSRPSDGRGAARVAAVLTLSTLATLASTAGAAIHVPERHSTIQGAIDAASPGDTVFVAPGTYTGEGNVGLDFGGKDIVLIAPGGPAA
jgi:pectin methylesterase-like acyl-CoA thioesterase